MIRSGPAREERMRWRTFAAFIVTTSKAGGVAATPPAVLREAVPSYVNARDVSAPRELASLLPPLGGMDAQAVDGPTNRSPGSSIVALPDVGARLTREGPAHEG